MYCMKLKLNNIVRWAVFAIAMVLCTSSFAQQTIRGTVTDANNGEPLIGASVLVVGTSTGTITDFDGTYTLEVPEGATQLEFSYTGYRAQTVDINGRDIIDLGLAPGQTLDEVVVIGYGTVQKGDATGAVLALDEKDFNQGVITSPDQLLQGRASGVQITPASGEPGAGATIRIRGASSIRAGNDPLIVLDGVPLDGRATSPGADVGLNRSTVRNPLNFINPNDIESISVLKDASATAIYGSRGANGVILITTKKGSQTRPELSFSASNTFSDLPDDRRYNLLSADQFIRETNNPNINFGDDVDAFDEIIRNAYTQQYNVSYGGSSETGRYRFSLGLTDQEGIIDRTGLEKYTGTVNITQDVFDDRLTIAGTLIGSFVEDQAAALQETASAEGDMLVSALRWNPTRPFQNPDGTFIQPSDNERNPLAFLAYYDDFTETARIFGNISANFKISDDWSYKFNFGVDRSTSTREVGVSRLFGANFALGTGVGNVGNLTASTVLYEHTVNYNGDITPNIGLNAILGYAYQTFNQSGSNQRGSNFLVDDQLLYTANLNFASAFPVANNSSFEAPNDELQSFFGRFIFDFSNRFVLTATLRADGSSRFGEGNKYGIFPSAALAWRMADEAFVPEAFDDLKLRLGFGITGNQEFPPGQSQDQFNPSDDGTGISQTVIGNPDLQWEETTQYNVGVDFAFLNYRLSGSVDFYYKETQDLLFRTRLPTPSPDIFRWRNLDGVTVENTGVDVEINGILKDTENLFWDFGINMSFLSNEVNGVSNIFPNGIITGEINGQGLTNQRAQLIFDGQELNAFYLPRFLGFNDNGEAIYADLNGDGQNTASGIVGPGDGDREFVGSPNPDFTIGIRSGVSFGNFDASIYAYGNFGQQVFDNTALALFNRAALNGGANVDDRVIDSGQGGSDSPLPSTLFLEDADFLRIATLTLGYNLDLANVSWLQSARVFVTGQNLFVFTDYQGFDPEVNVNKAVDDVPSFGIDYSSYPRARSFILGVNLNF